MSYSGALKSHAASLPHRLAGLRPQLQGDKALAIGWFAAFKKIPWTDVMSAAPSVVQGTKTLWDRVIRKGPDAPAANSHEVQPSSDAEATPGIERRLRALEVAIAESKSEAASSAELISSLAKQNSRLVEAVEILRIRTRYLLVFCSVLAVILVGVALWVQVR